jgi:hypothetical protein
MEAPIETFVKDFVWARTGETVYIDLSTPSVVLIRDITTHGSKGCGDDHVFSNESRTFKNWV